MVFGQEYLPIGTVVTLTGGQKKLMIFGIMQNVESQEGEKIEYDYIGVPYPEGNMGAEYQYMFNHKDVEKIYFKGFRNIEYQELMDNINEYYEQTR